VGKEPEHDVEQDEGHGQGDAEEQHRHLHPVRRKDEQHVAVVDAAQHHQPHRRRENGEQPEQGFH
jgi:hypothetical protein